MQCLKSGRCRKRKIQTLGLILVIVIVYFLLQFFTLSKLGHFQGGKIKLRFGDAEVGDDKAAATASNMGGDSAEWKINQQPMIITAPRGVHPSDALHYAEDSTGLFKCLKSEVLIL